MNINKINTKSHAWNTYLNPRNQRVQLKACATCGIIKGAASEASECGNITQRVSNMLEQKGWVVAGQRAAA